MSIDSKRFVILAMARTGSYMLTSFLNTYDDIVCFGELLKKNPLNEIDHLGLFDKIDNKFNTLKYRQKHYKEYLENIFSICSDKPYIGFKLMLAQNEKALKHIIDDDRYKIILLYRKNILASYSSMLISKATGQAVARTNEDIKKANIYFKQKHFERFWRRRDRLYAKVRSLLKEHRDYLEIEYDTIRLNSGLQGVVNFVGAKYEYLPQLVTRKRNTSDIINRFVNCNEVEAYLSCINHEDWAIEGDI